MSLVQQRRLTHKTPDQREARLEQVTIAQQRRLTHETPDQREARLEQMSLAQQRRLTHETPGQREARLEQVSLAQQSRLTHQTPDQREARLEQMSLTQQRRLTHETPEETTARCEQDRESHRRRREQQSVCTKIVNFHSHLAALHVSKCITCLENFPGLNVRTVSPDSCDTECVRCSQDKHIPKLYSFMNNIDPGPVPPELQVGVS